MRIKSFLLNKHDPLSWAVMPQVLKRLKRFCVVNELDHDPEILANAIMINFVSDDPVMVAGVAIGDHKVLGHLVAGLDEFMGERYLTIIQYERDKEAEFFENKNALEATFRNLCEWGQKRGASQVQLLTPDNRRANYFARFYGFKPHRILMRKSINEEKH